MEIVVLVSVLGTCERSKRSLEVGGGDASQLAEPELLVRKCL
jgi:hypothetical protein